MIVEVEHQALGTRLIFSNGEERWTLGLKCCKMLALKEDSIWQTPRIKKSWYYTNVYDTEWKRWNDTWYRVATFDVPRAWSSWVLG